MGKIKCLHTFVVLAYKESSYLEECINSVTNQKYKSKVIIATSTPNDYISDIAFKYNLEVVVNPDPGKGIGYDFDFAVSIGDTNLVTVAHQDDVYDYEYSFEMVKGYEHNNYIMAFSDYYEIRDNYKVNTNTNLRIKRILLLPIKIKHNLNSKFWKRFILRFGNTICCPAVTFNKSHLKNDDIFKCNMKSNVDWYAWEKLSMYNGSFYHCGKRIMGHRVHEESTTTDIINDHIRTKEDMLMFKKFWPKPIANLINKFYVKAENSNQ